MASQEKPLAVYGAMAANLAIAASKFVAAGFSGSSAMLSEGIFVVAKALRGRQESRPSPAAASSDKL